MISQKYKIPRKDFPSREIRTKTWSGEFLRIRSYTGTFSGPFFAILTSKKTYSTKPERNVFKRRVFAIIQKHLHRFKNTPRGYFLIFPLIHTGKITFQNIETDIQNYISSLEK